MTESQGQLPEEIARLLAESERHAEQVDRTRLQPAPLAGLAILTCMDTRMVIEDIFGLRAGDANIIRNAGAVASDDAIRSILLSQQVLGTTELVVLAHTGCGLKDLAEQELRARLTTATAQDAGVEFGSFSDLDQHVIAQVGRLRSHPWIRRAPGLDLVDEAVDGRVRRVV
ncbi:MAG TPA: carbonic anhydrase [Candidatus Limnocylindrales bacterium]|nr:carbonic anhydrase [Candidatus Limnocylindrales bacterium]